MIVEKEKFHDIKIGTFYLRRMLRIWPLFYLCVFLGFVIFPVFKSMLGGEVHEIAHWQYYVAFLNNFDFIKFDPDSSALSILWSIAVEEQFYLIWPVLLCYIPKRAYLPVFFTIIVVSFGFRYLHADNELILKFHTLSCISDMTIGGICRYTHMVP